MSVVLGKRLRSDPGARPLRQRAELSGVSASEDSLARLSRLFAQVPRDTLMHVLEASDGDFEAAVAKVKTMVETAPEAVEVVERCAGATSLPEAAAIIEAGLRLYHDRRKPVCQTAPADKQVEGLLRDNTVLKKAVRFLHEKLQQLSSEVEENERIRRELEKERQAKEGLLFHLHRCNL